MFNYQTTYSIDPCSSGVLNLSTANMYEPVTNTQVINFRWKVPAGWSLGGQLSNGTDWIYSGQNVTATYPASITGGTIEVQGSIVVLGCTAETQFSNTSTAVTVSRTANFTLTANKSVLLCGDTSPVTYTVTPALSCATYYWNGSPTPSTSNTYQFTPDGINDFTVNVNIFYGGTSQTKNKTISYIPFEIDPYIDGDNEICLGSNSTYSVTYLRPGYTVTYEKSENLSISQTGNNCTLTANGNGTGWLKANINTPCGPYSKTLYKEIWVGLPAAPVFEVIEPVECDFLYVVKNENNESVTWSVSPPLRIVGQNVGYRCTFEATGSGYAWVTATAQNSCGSVYEEQEIYAECFDFLLSPNPASTEVLVTLQSEEYARKSLSSKVITEKEYNVRIVDNMGTVIYNGKKQGNLFSLPISRLKDGIYIVEISSNKKSANKQLIIKH
jgi:hypothetical protein